VATSPSVWYSKVDFIIRNQVDDMVLMPSICHMPKGKMDGDFSTMILPKRSVSIKVKASHMIAGRIKCCLVYELVDQKNENKPIMGYHQVFIAVNVIIIPFTNNYKAFVVMFMARKGQFTGSEEDMKRLKEVILREHLVNNAYSFRCTIKDQTLRLKALFRPGRQTCIEVILEETDKYANKRPVLFK
jgi:hypothetical protein